MKGTAKTEVSEARERRTVRTHWVPYQPQGRQEESRPICDQKVSDQVQVRPETKTHSLPSLRYIRNTHWLALAPARDLMKVFAAMAEAP